MELRRLGLFTAGLLALLGLSYGSLTAAQETSPPPSTATITLEQENESPPHSATADVVAKVLPSVVNVRVRSQQFDPFGGTQEVEGEGSGFIVDPSGIIVTNFHVVRNAQDVTVALADGRSLDGTVLGGSPEHDLAVIEVKADGLKAASLGTSSELRLGDEVVALGFPLGLGSNATVTKGILSARGRTIQPQGGPRLTGLLQTDAAINPGNSGGPLVDMNGNVVGINSAAASAGAAENIGFAIPIDSALPVIQGILKEPPEERAYLGVIIVSTQEVDPGLLQELRIDPGLEGALVTDVETGGPAEEAGLQRGDVIVRVGDKTIASADDLTTALQDYSPGDRVEITFVRGGQSRQTEATLSQRPVTLQG